MDEIMVQTLPYFWQVKHKEVPYNTHTQIQPNTPEYTHTYNQINQIPCTNKGKIEKEREKRKERKEKDDTK